MTTGHWYLNPNHKHHRSAMVINLFLIGMVMIIIGIIGISISEIFALACFILSGVSFASGFYYIVNKKKKKTVKKMSSNSS